MATYIQGIQTSVGVVKYDLQRKLDALVSLDKEFAEIVKVIGIESIYVCSTVFYGFICFGPERAKKND